MKVALFEIHRPGDKKEFNGGFGTTFEIGNNVPAQMMAWIRTRTEYLPLLTYGYLAAILKKNGHSVIHVRNKMPQNVDLIILQSSLIRYKEEIRFLKQVRQEKRAKTCVVGPLSSKMPELYQEFADLVVRQESETLFKNVFSLEDVPSGVYEGALVEHLDELPFPDWSIYNYRKFSQYPLLKGRPMAIVLGSRSCPYLCEYCPYIVHKQSYRIRSVANVIEEIHYLKKNYQIRSILFRDPIFTLNREWVLQLCQEMVQQKIEMEWACETRTDRLDTELLDAMHQAGMRVLKTGIESFDLVALKKMRRSPPMKEKQEKMVRYAESKGIKIVAFYIFGLPDDTLKSMKQTINYAKSLNTSFANFTVCTPLPGTEFYEKYKHEIFDHDWTHYDNFHPVFHTAYLTPKQIKRFHEKAVLKYYLRWNFFKKLVHNFFRL